MGGNPAADDVSMGLNSLPLRMKASQALRSIVKMEAAAASVQDSSLGDVCLLFATAKGEVDSFLAFLQKSQSFPTDFSYNL
eukprot:12034781-Alexandrium_andersonii.AAC.1